MKALHFGAGNIGRGLVGLLLTQSGYDVTFVARNEKQVALIEREQRYTVVMAGEQEQTLEVEGVRAIHTRKQKEIEAAIVEADLITTAVGTSALKHIAESIAAGITQRLLEHPRPLHIIACENAKKGSSLLKKWVYSYFHDDLQELADRYIAFPNAAIDRIVPNQRHKGDPLKVRVELFYEWIVDRSMMFEDYPQIKGVKYVDALKPYIERKLFTVNTGHACAAYFGYLEGYETIQQALADSGVMARVRGVLRETGAMLIEKHGFEKRDNEAYAERTLERFANPGLIDKVVRVGRSPIRKLGPGDRLVKPALQAHQYGLSCDRLAEAMAAALLFDYAEDPEAVKLQQALADKGLDGVLSDLLGIAAEHPLHAKIAMAYEELRAHKA
ncbi:mannitol-1-phosphate 5-dehydrogenase [Paenibacillus sp. IB182496]|uniref:Mannitol-1-phosphate 5-dehydrogenase n=1 Tax=Paenibacillus sabuli TaxID=2772509 RepID=A0A927GTH0_9BACL|nr:mannitol-1-phosphate 5-dehydrogenase [Paenibacillus sabuli]MBD2846722.1 mannitol-1-phosphate 5-dehydrogenase [Paenibacillus sabuli]